MKVFRQTRQTNDIYVDASTGSFAIADGKDGDAFIIADTIRTAKGELQFDIERGIPYFESVFASPDGVKVFKMYASKLILALDFVVSINSFEVEWKRGGILSYTLVVETDSGTTEVSSSYIPSSGGGGMQNNLVQDGIFYLPVYLEYGVQVYRKLMQYVDDEVGVSTQISDTLYVKDSNGLFVEKE